MKLMLSLVLVAAVASLVRADAQQVPRADMERFLVKRTDGLGTCVNDQAVQTALERMAPERHK